MDNYKDFIKEINTKEKQDVKRDYVQQVFTKIAPVYDLMNTLMSFGLHYRWRKFSGELTNLKNGGYALDMCTGTGDFAIELAKIVGKEGKVKACDFCEAMVEEGREKIKNTEMANVIEFCIGNIENIPFPDNEFDAITVSCGVRNSTDILKSFKEMTRVVKHGGRVVCLDLGHPEIPVFREIYNFYFFKFVPCLGKIILGEKDPYNYLPHSLITFPTQKELKKIMEEAGLRNVKYYNLLGGAMAVHVGEKE
ncbi:MAG: bifunctional demethylmenaquinone methyltransferase/2-methoxy-6-polyprenyl-1,4-benzoquinol methylase UbiE [Candidatus Firestonebacteria bacterium]|nr:bifunctional demethylmenaquinone methyltransferase/2-methoxy-6-polyprenyl-1,4-benzoquinol methylase UbiE [Candidatus Firestonebacteria bacterium]